MTDEGRVRCVACDPSVEFPDYETLRSHFLAVHQREPVKIQDYTLRIPFAGTTFHVLDHISIPVDAGMAQPGGAPLKGAEGGQPSDATSVLEREQSVEISGSNPLAGADPIFPADHPIAKLANALTEAIELVRVKDARIADLEHWAYGMALELRLRRRALNESVEPGEVFGDVEMDLDKIEATLPEARAHTTTIKPRTEAQG